MATSRSVGRLAWARRPTPVIASAEAAAAPPRKRLRGNARASASRVRSSASADDAPVASASRAIRHSRASWRSERERGPIGMGRPGCRKRAARVVRNEPVAPSRFRRLGPQPFGRLAAAVATLSLTASVARGDATGSFAESHSRPAAGLAQGLAFRAVEVAVGRGLTVGLPVATLRESILGDLDLEAGSRGGLRQPRPIEDLQPWVVLPEDALPGRR